MERVEHIAILHTTPATIGSLREISARQLPGVCVYNYLDESLLPQINAEGKITDAVRERFSALVALAAAAGPKLILSACSTVGGLMESLRPAYAPLHLLRIDEPMAEQAAACPGSVVVCATLASTLGPTLTLLRRKLPEGREADSLLIEEAGPLLAAGKQEEYLDAIASRLTEAARSHDVVVLAQASMAKALDRLPEATRAKFLTSPESGIAALKQYL